MSGIYIPRIRLELGRNKAVKCMIRNLDGDVEFGIKVGGHPPYEHWSFYPIKFVQTHGDLIDASKLIKQNTDERGSCFGSNSAVIVEAVENAPVIIESDETLPELF